MRRFITASSLLACAAALTASSTASADAVGQGLGTLGAFVAPAGSSTINKYTTLTSAAVQSTTALAVNDTSICTNGGALLLWVSSGYTPATFNNTSVTVSASGSFGHYEFVRLKAAGGCTGVAAPGTLSLASGISIAYPANTTQVVSVPEYTTVDVPATATLVPATWSPNFGTGGIVVFLATGAVTVEGGIRADGLGYVGGNSSSNCVSDTKVEGDLTSANNGDDITRSGLFTNKPGYQNLGNGGGGGLCNQSGGGGGGNVGAGGSGHLSDGASLGGQGGANVIFGAGLSDFTTLVMGGGGGGGAAALATLPAPSPTAGSPGGGVVFFRGASLGFSGAVPGAVTADGSSPVNTTRSDGAGGGGAGGTVAIQLAGAQTLGCSQFSAAGGDGGGTAGAGGGGGGGGGRLFIQSSSPVCTTTSLVKGGGATSGLAGGDGLIDPSTGSLFCTSSATCKTQYGSAKPICDTNSNLCVQCTDATGCTPATPTCVNEACTAACGSNGGDSYCATNFTADPYCDTTSGACVQCNVGGATTECTDPATPICASDSCQGCSSDAQCTGLPNGRTHCVAGACDQCITSGADPTCGPTTPICASGACGGSCTKNADCTGRSDGNVVCDTGTGACVPCNVTGATMECPATTPSCISDACTKCTTNSDCATRTDGNTSCDATSGACAPCNTSGPTVECPDSAPVCMGDQCGVCTSDIDCGGRTNALCDGGKCVACKTSGFDTGCAQKNPLAPICAGDVCTGCISGTQCPSTTPICSGGGCGKCTADTQCASEHAPLSFCNTTAGTCVACTADSQCTSASAPSCVGNVCSAGCTSNTVCAANHSPADPLCDTLTTDALKGECVGCLSASNCTFTAPTCPTATRACSACGSDTDCASYTSTPHCDGNADAHKGQCVRCTTSTQCPGTSPVCNGNDACVGCTSNTDCNRFLGSLGIALCNTGTGACVSCVNNSNCSASAPVCTNNSCVSCATDNDCSLYDAQGKPACQPAGTTNGGQCEQCNRDNTASCKGSTPACNFQNGLCQLCTVGAADMGADADGCAGNTAGTACQGSGTSVFCGCYADSDCGGDTSGRICDPVKHTCADGCSRAPGRNNCPSGQFCTSDDDSGQTTGICTKTCAFNVDCQSTMPTLPYCLGGVLLDGGATLPDGGDSSSRCAGCRTDGDCSAATSVCEPSAKICVECTDDNVSGCSAQATGAICLSDETCGCATDSDCGDSSSGRICDRFTQKCTTGCYLLGGNGCPSGSVCSAAGASAGICLAPNDMSMSTIDLAVTVDMSTPADHALNHNSVTGGGLTCSMQRGGSPQSLWLLAAVGLWLALRRRRRATATAATNRSDS